MITRRDVLALMASVALPIPQIEPRQAERLQRRGPAQQVLVLGGGLAGLSAAYELQNLGHTVTVLEAQSRPGGRVRTVREPFAPGLYTEAGPETIPAVHDLTQHYARELGLRLVPITVPGTRFFYHVKGQRIAPSTGSGQGTEPVWPYDLTAEERALGMPGLTRKYIEQARNDAMAAGYDKQPVRAMQAWDAHTPGAWLRSQGASPAAIEMLTLGFGAELGSAASFLLHGLNSRGPGVSYRVEGGNDGLPRELAKRVTIRYGTPVVGVRQDDRGVEVTVRAGGGSETLRADRIVCALPTPVIGKMFDESRLSAAKQRAIREQHYARVVKVFLQSRTRFWLRDGFSGFVSTDLPIERLTPDPGADSGERGALAAYPMGVYTDALERMTETERVSAALAQAAQIFPELARSCEGGVSYSWGLDPWQRGSFALHAPGQIGFIDTLAQAEGRIHFAGEHTSVWTGWMQGAFDSARRVVREINQ